MEKSKIETFEEIKECLIKILAFKDYDTYVNIYKLSDQTQNGNDIEQIIWNALDKGI